MDLPSYQNIHTYLTDYISHGLELKLANLVSLSRSDHNEYCSYIH